MKPGTYHTLTLSSGSSYSGWIRPSWKYDPPGTIRITVEEEHLRRAGFRERVLPLSSITEIDEEPFSPSSQTQEDQEWDVPSSRGDTHYKVRRRNSSWTCTCKGFLFRRTCKHITLISKEVSQ